MSEHEQPKVVLIGGTSHAGKSTIARELGRRLDADVISTDALARHPGRPWREDGDLAHDVIDYFTQGKDLTERMRRALFLDDVWHHYTARVWPIVQAMVRCRLDNAFDRPLVLEGSAIVPLADPMPRFETVFLTLDEQVLIDRLHDTSHYMERCTEHRALIDTFVMRSVDFQTRLVQATPSDQLLDVTNDASMNQLFTRLGVNVSV